MNKKTIFFSFEKNNIFDELFLYIFYLDLKIIINISFVLQLLRNDFFIFYIKKSNRCSIT